MIPALCGGSEVRNSAFLSIFVEISPLDAGVSRRKGRRVERDGPPETQAATNVKSDQELGAAPLMRRAEKTFLSGGPRIRFRGIDVRKVRPISFSAAAARRIA